MPLGIIVLSGKFAIRIDAKDRHPQRLTVEAAQSKEAESLLAELCAVSQSGSSSAKDADRVLRDVVRDAEGRFVASNLSENALVAATSNDASGVVFGHDPRWKPFMKYAKVDIRKQEKLTVESALDTRPKQLYSDNRPPILFFRKLCGPPYADQPPEDRNSDWYLLQTQDGAVHVGWPSGSSTSA